jgi:hypothetical protein
LSINNLNLIEQERKPMSLGIAFKGPEGIVLAADSRVTLTAEIQRDQGKMTLPSTFDNATKLLQIPRQKYVGVVTYGLGAIGLQEPRTAYGFLPEFEGKLADKLAEKNTKRLSVEDFSKAFSDFFMEQWTDKMPKDYTGLPMTFLVGGFNKDEPYGKVYKIDIPSQPTPQEQQSAGQFGITWGGQQEHTTRLLKGFDPGLLSIVQEFLQLTDEQRIALERHLENKLSSRIPYQFLPLQDCVDLSVFLIRTTIEIQNWTVDVRGVGGAIDVATITRTDGFQSVQQKKIVGQRKTR